MTARQKRGTAAERKAVADFAREARAQFPHLKGNFSRRAWNHAISGAIFNRLSKLITARRMSALTPELSGLDREYDRG